MNIQLCIVLFVFLILSWILNRKDIMSPWGVINMIFLVISYISIYIGDAWDLHIAKETFAVLSLGILSIGIGTIISKLVNRILGKRSLAYLNNEIKTIIIYNENTLVVISVLIFWVALVSIMSVARSISGTGSLSSLIYAYRLNSLAGSNTLPSIISNLILINYAVGYIALYVIINNWFSEHSVNKKLLISVLLPAFIGLLQGARGNLVQYILFSVVVYYYLYLIHTKKRNIDVTLLVKIVVVLAIAIAVFYFLKVALGRQNEMGFVEYIGGLLCAPIKLLDVFIAEHHSKSAVWGLETFTNLISTIRKWSGQTGFIYRDYATYRMINGISLGNVYTAFRAYYSDFGMQGVFWCPMGIGLLTGWAYERAKSAILYKSINPYLFIYGYFFYGIAMLFYSNTFFEYIANVSFLKMLIVWYMAYQVFIKGKILIKLK